LRSAAAPSRTSADPDAHDALFASVTPSPPAPRSVALAVGHAAGHVMPALAVAEAYRRIAHVDVLVRAPADGPAVSIARKAGYRTETVAGSAIARVGAIGKLDPLGRPGARRARALLARHDTRLAIGFGGYSTGSVILAARALGLATAIVDRN
jgi:UDP-N-acetylglucosamine--N-acetylmuramyl-(pentapeptide) pyrophosphoryl-undecaprenol N-acetylglucosamine transferase